MRGLLARGAAVIAMAMLLLPVSALADEAMWKLLQGGGHVDLFGRPDLVATQVARLKLLASETPLRGNTVMVSHGSTILALTGISPATGEMVVLAPAGHGRFRVAGRITVD